MILVDIRHQRTASVAKRLLGNIQSNPIPDFPIFLFFLDALSSTLLDNFLEMSRVELRCRYSSPSLFAVFFLVASLTLPSIYYHPLSPGGKCEKIYGIYT